LQVRDDLSNGRAKLVRIHDTSEATPGGLPLVSKSEKIVVLREHHPTQLGRAGKQLLVGGVGVRVFKGRENVDAAPSQPFCDCAANVVVHVKGQAHGWFLIPLSLLATGEFPSRDWISPTFRSRWAMSCSSSS